MRVYELLLPQAPTVNHYYGVSGKRRDIKPEGEAFRLQVQLAVRAAKIPKLLGRVFLHMRVHPKDRRTRDIDNLAKATLDALQHAQVYENDSQVDDLHIVRGGVVQGGRMEVLIGEIDERKSN